MPHGRKIKMKGKEEESFLVTEKRIKVNYAVLLIS